MPKPRKPYRYVVFGRTGDGRLAYETVVTEPRKAFAVVNWVRVETKDAPNE